VRVVPRASKPGVAGMRGGALLIRLQSPPVEGAANEELIQVLANAFGVAKRDVTLLAGQHSKVKRVAIANRDRHHIDKALRSLGIDPQQLSS
jgi:uncharacterized protein